MTGIRILRKSLRLNCLIKIKFSIIINYMDNVTLAKKNSINNLVEFIGISYLYYYCIELETQWDCSPFRTLIMC